MQPKPGFRSGATALSTRLHSDGAAVALSHPWVAGTILRPSGGLREQESGTSAGKLQLSQPSFVEPLKFGLKTRKPITVTLGALPFSKSGSRTSLADFTAATADRIREHYLYPNGSLIGFGYDIDGYLRVSIWNDPPLPENVSSVEAVYALLDGWAEEMGTKNIPVKFTVFHSPVIGPQKDLSGWMRLCGAA